MLIRQNFNRYLAEETISIDLVSTQKPEEPYIDQLIELGASLTCLSKRQYIAFPNLMRYTKILTPDS